MGRGMPYGSGDARWWGLLLIKMRGRALKRINSVVSLQHHHRTDTTFMKQKGYIVIDEVEGESYLITDATGVAELVGVSRATVWRWFKALKLSRNVRYGRWLIYKDYEHVKSRRYHEGRDHKGFPTRAV